MSPTNEKAITNYLVELTQEKGSQMNSDDVEDTADIITKVHYYNIEHSPVLTYEVTSGFRFTSQIQYAIG